MLTTLINCPSCQKEVSVSVDMYIDSGDVCYDIIPNHEQMDEAEKVIDEGWPFVCLSCKTIVEVQIDPEYWGSIDAPLLVKVSPSENNEKKNPFKTKTLSFEGGRVSIDFNLNVDMLDNITKAIETIKENRGTETELTLSLADLQYLRSLLVSDAVRSELSVYNLKESLAYLKMKKEENSNE